MALHTRTVLVGRKSVMARPLIATWYRKPGQPAMKTRHYARLTTAVPRSIALLLEEAHPGDVVEIAHSEWGFQVATIKVHVSGKIDLNWTIL